MDENFKRDDILKVLNAFRLARHKYIKLNHDKYKIAYYLLFLKLTKDLKNEKYFEEYARNLKQTLKIKEPLQAKNCKILTKKVKGCVFIYPLILESVFLLSLQNDFDVNTWLEKFQKDFNLQTNVIKWFQEFFYMLKHNNLKNIYFHCKNTKNIPCLKQSINHISNTILQILRYNLLKQKHIAIVSTMSSGKSTFINALIGNEIFPETQQACTAKITSIYDNDNLDNINGISFYKNQIKHTKISVNKDIAKKWNDDDKIDRIIFEENLKNIYNDDKIVVVHATPGTNFSSNEEHKKTTIQFLENMNLDCVIFLINAMYIGTCDSLELLQQIYKITKNKNIEILFVLNKIDTINKKDGDIDEILKKVKIFIEKAGFKNPTIITTSAKATRLFKMALEGKSDEFSEDEEDDFYIFFKKFFKDEENQQNEIKNIKIGTKKYSKEQIENALKNTNFHIIEKIVDKTKEKK